MNLKAIISSVKPWVRQTLNDARQWVRQNLLSTKMNTLITFICLFIIYHATLYLWDLIFNSNWDVIWANRRLLAFGLYFTRTPEELWRVKAPIYLIAALIGAAYGTMREARWKFIVPFAVFSGIMLYLIYLPTQRGYEYEAPFWFLARAFGGTLLAFLATHHLLRDSEEHRVNSVRRYLGYGGVLTFFLLIYLLDPPGEEGVRPSEWGGLLLNVVIAAASGVLSLVIGTLLAYGRQSRLPVFHYPSVAVIELIRSGPMVAWLFIAYILVPDVLRPVWDADSVTRTILIISLFGGCYLAEILRGGLQSVPSGQIEAAKSLGLSPLQTKIHITLPIAVRTTLPAIVSLIIALWKDTSLIYLLGVHDMFSIAQILPNQLRSGFSGLYKEVILFAGFVFWIVSYYLSRISRRIERSLGLKREGGGEQT